MMIKRSRLVLIICCLLATLLPLIVFLNYFWKQSISYSLGDWADFGTYIGSTVQVFLSIINIYIFFILTELAARINRNSNSKQLIQNSFKIYQESINQVTMEVLSCLERFNFPGKQYDNFKQYEMIKNRIAWLQMISDSFMSETEPILRKINSQELNSSYSEFSELLSSLLDTSSTIDLSKLNLFFEKKSQFVKNLNEIIFTYYGEE